MAKNLKNLFGLISEKTVPPIDSINEETREGKPKAYIPNFFYKPPFGYPRFVDLTLLRRLAASPFVDMCINTIVDNISAIPWDIVPKEESDEITEEVQKKIDHVKSFFDNPNTNKESWEKIQRVFVRDILEIDSGVINKIFNLKEEMVEIVARDGATFTKNPDLYGFITDRDDLLLDYSIGGIASFTTPEIDKLNEAATAMEPGWINEDDVRERAAYFQYGWISGARPVPFGKKEIVWLERNPRSDSVYGRSPVEILAESIQTLIYAIEHNLDYFRDNSIPPGVLGLEGSDSNGIAAFKEQWEEQQKIKDSSGKWKKLFHKLPIVGHMPKFEKMGFTNAELQLIEGQKWWSKMVWACFGVTPTELGYTEDAKGMANQIVQSEVFRKRAINPILRLIEYHINSEIISEFGYDDIKYTYLVFDVEEETKKANLHKLQIDNGTRTVNEIRKSEGLDEVEWGDDDPKRNQGNNFNFNDPRIQEQSRRQEESENASRKPKEEQPKEKKTETKPFAGYSNFDECVSKNKDKKDPDAYCATIMRQAEGKTMASEQNPLIPKENEVMDAEKLKKCIQYLMKQNEKKLKEMIEKEMGVNQINEIKSVDDIAKRINELVIFEGLKSVSDMVIKNTFLNGWDQAEKQMNQNFMMNKEVITFIQDYTFNNIMDLTEEIKNDLRAELKRGIMAGEGVSNLKKRIEKVFDVGDNRAEMIARTETNRAENQGKLQAFKSSSEDFNKRWVATKDERTSPICMRLHGQTVGINENFKDSSSGWEGPAPPSHVNCRSAVIYLSKKETEAEKKAKEDALSLEMDLKLKEKELAIKEKKENLLKKLEVDVDARTKNISRQGKK